MATVNSTSNSAKSTSSSKSDNGFCIIGSLSNSSSDSYIQKYSAISFDAVTDLGVRRRANVTSYPVEKESDVSDHIQITNDKFTLSGIISETPLALREDEISAAGINGTRISQAISYLNKVFEAKQTISLITRDQVLDSVVLTNIEYNYTSEDAMKFDLSFERVRLVSSKTVDLIATKTKSSSSKGKTVKTKVNTATKKDTTVSDISSKYNS
ncbi:phage baseplate protein [Klebsiella sp. KE9038]|uniref:phage baseplate protein n=1 Tax=Klebsiella TaxID=570 RepID=UPI0012B745B0|nr:hypothetical protein [Klebsiella grimontii]